MRVIFVHHSVGRFLIAQGGVRERWAARNAAAGTAHELWDHDYNAVGLTGPDGTHTGENYAIPDDNTEPAGFAALFAQPVHDPPDNALSRLLQYDVIAFKSCFPACHIRSDTQLAQYQRAYEAVRATVAQHPGTLFLALTPPPLVRLPGLPALHHDWTTAAEAGRARAFARWLASGAFTAGLPNLAVFDLFDALAVPAGRPGANGLRPAYRARRLIDAHPTPPGYRAVAPRFVDFLWTEMTRFAAVHRRGAETQRI